MDLRAIYRILPVAFVIALTVVPLRSSGQAPAAGTEVRIITLGTAGGPLPRKDRAQSSNALVVNGNFYIIDAGDGVTRRIVQSGLNFRNVKAIFITHDHSDHTMGLATLLVTEWEYQRREPLNVYGPPGTATVVAGVLPYAAVNADIRYGEGKTEPMPPLFRGFDVQPGTVYHDENVTVTAVENAHFHFQPGTPPYGRYKSYSYRFATPRGAVVFTGDTGPSDAVTEFARNATALVTEVESADEVFARYAGTDIGKAKTPAEQAGFVRHLREDHLETGDVGRMASRAKVKSVILTHLPPTKDPDDQYARYGVAVRSIYSGPVTVAKDLMSIPL